MTNTKLFASARRLLLSRPGLTFAAILSLALTIAANTGMFSVVHAVLFQSLPYESPEEIVRVRETYVYPGGTGKGSVSLPNLEDWKKQAKSFEKLGAYTTQSVNLTGGDIPLRIPGSALSGDLLAVLGVQPMHGRGFTEQDLEAGQDRSILLSHELWQAMYGGERSIIGQDLLIDGESHQVIGIMGPEFRFPPLSDSQIWLPLTADESQRNNRGLHWVEVVGRLAPGVSPDAARSELKAVAAHLEGLYPEAQKQRGVDLEVLSEVVVGDVRPILIGLWVAVGLVLLIGCANVSSLLLADTMSRQGEYALRTALGAGKSKIIGQIFLRSLLLALIGGGVGILLSYFLVKLLVGLAADILPRVDEVELDLTVLLFSLATTLLVAVLSSLLPMLRVSRGNLRSLLTEADDTRSHGKGVYGSLIVAEVALAQLVMIGAGLILLSFFKLQAVDPGLDSTDVMTMRISLPQSRYAEPEQINAFWDELLEAAHGLPGVESAGFIHRLPLKRWGYSGGFLVEGGAASSEKPYTDFRIVSPEYFASMDIPLLQGRQLTEGDNGESSSVVLVNETLAQRYWNGEPVGKRLGLGDPEAGQGTWLEIVGVVGDVKSMGLAEDIPGEVYLPYLQNPIGDASLAVEASIPPESLVGLLRSEVSRLDPQLPLYEIEPMAEVVASNLSRWRFNAFLFTTFAALALLLALAGVYGIMAYEVVQRTSEIGLRMALGSQRRDVLVLMLKRGLLLASIGIAMGTTLALGLTRYLSSRLYELEAGDPLTLLATGVVLLVAALVACGLPAYRAGRLDPLVALRHSSAP